MWREEAFPGGIGGDFGRTRSGRGALRWRQRGRCFGGAVRRREIHCDLAAGNSWVPTEGGEISGAGGAGAASSDHDDRRVAVILAVSGRGVGGFGASPFLEQLVRPLRPRHPRRATLPA